VVVVGVARQQSGDEIEGMPADAAVAAGGSSSGNLDPGPQPGPRRDLRKRDSTTSQTAAKESSSNWDGIERCGEPLERAATVGLLHSVRAW
jgi:hypothetical protein